MKTNGLDFEALRCASLVGEFSEHASIRVEKANPARFLTPPDVVRANDVLYLPELRLQVIGGTMVPQEAVPEPWTLGFEIKRGFQGRAERYRSEFDRAYSTQEVCILSNFYSRNFYHWVTEELPKVVILERHGFAGRYVLADLPKFAFELLGMLGVADDRVIVQVDQPTVFATVLYTTSIHGWNVLEHHEVVLALRDSLLGTAGVSHLSNRLWMDRGVGVNNKGRELVNTEEVHAVLRRYGFEVVDMAALPVREQIAAAHNAAALAGPHGAGFVHVMFQKHRSSVIECFSPQFINPGVLEICRLLNHRYSMLVHENAYDSYPFGHQLKINCSHLELALQGLQ